MRTVRVAAAQTPEFHDDIDGAIAWAGKVVGQAQAAGASLVCFPEGYLQGYLTDEAAARRDALDLSSAAFSAVLERLPNACPLVVMGLIETQGGKLFNSAVVIAQGALVGRYRKAHLLRGEAIFEAGQEPQVFEAAGLRFGINICYDTNFPEAARGAAALGATLILCPANNMHRRATSEAFKHVHNEVRGERCREAGVWLLSADVTGEREGRISWGPTALLNPAGEVVAQLPLEQPGLLVCDIPLPVANGAAVRDSRASAG